MCTTIIRQGARIFSEYCSNSGKFGETFSLKCVYKCINTSSFACWECVSLAWFLVRCTAIILDNFRSACLSKAPRFSSQIWLLWIFHLQQKTDGCAINALRFYKLNSKPFLQYLWPMWIFKSLPVGRLLHKCFFFLFRRTHTHALSVSNLRNHPRLTSAAYSNQRKTAALMFEWKNANRWKSLQFLCASKSSNTDR